MPIWLSPNLDTPLAVRRKCVVDPHVAQNRISVAGSSLSCRLYPVVSPSTTTSEGWT